MLLLETLMKELVWLQQSYWLYSEAFHSAYTIVNNYSFLFISKRAIFIIQL